MHPNESESLAQLRGISYRSFVQYVMDLLEAVGAPAPTLARLREHAAANPGAPIQFHTRAIFFDVRDEDPVESLARLKNGLSAGLLTVFCISERRVAAENLTTGERAEFDPSEVVHHSMFLLPLMHGRRANSPEEENRKLGELITILRNKLTTKSKSGKTQEAIPSIILDVVKIGIHRCFASDSKLDFFIRNAELESDDLRKAKYIQLLISSEYSVSAKCLSKGHLSEIVDTHVLVEIGKLLSFNYRDLDCEVIGSLIYRIVDTSQETQSHTVSELNSLKILTPLLIEPYLQDGNQSKNIEADYVSVFARLASLKFLDPTNGTGMILATAMSSIGEWSRSKRQFGNLSEVLRIENFVAVTDDSLGAEITRITLWLSYISAVSRDSALVTRDVLSAYERTRVHVTDPLTADWSVVFDGSAPDLIVGAPTFKGWNKMAKADKDRFSQIDESFDPVGLDFSAAWLLKASQLVQTSATQACFALTNSLVQGGQVELLWPSILSRGIEIASAFPSIKWTNDGRQATGVSVVVIAIRARTGLEKLPTLRYGDRVDKVNVIGPYLIDGISTIVKSRQKRLSEQVLPAMSKGNMPYDKGGLLLSPRELGDLLAESPAATKYIRKFVGSDEFINSIERYCLWIPTEDLSEARSIPEIRRRIDAVAQYRAAKKDEGARRIAKTSHQFREFRSTASQSLVVPSVSSELRRYIPIGFVGKDTIVSNLCFVIYECESWLLALLSSAMHMNWIRTTCGNLETRLRYSSTLGYNTFPVPPLDEKIRLRLSVLAYDLVASRERYLDSSLGEIYTAMPRELESCHTAIDELVEEIYGVRNQDEIGQLRTLMKMYSEAVSDVEK